MLQNRYYRSFRHDPHLTDYDVQLLRNQKNASDVHRFTSLDTRASRNWVSCYDEDICHQVGRFKISRSRCWYIPRVVPEQTQLPPLGAHPADDRTRSSGRSASKLSRLIEFMTMTLCALQGLLIYCRQFDRFHDSLG
jgi:hypothetical protein